MKIIIYATHSEGTLYTLIQHPDVVLLGFGTKWKGFIERAKCIYDYLNTLPDNEVVAIVDGFDSYIKKTTGLREEFEKMDCKVLVSLHSTTLPKFIDDYTAPKIFTSCKDNYIANAGLMMGYVHYLKILFTKMKGPSDDDQRNLNIACKDLPFLKMDLQKKILDNCSNEEEVNKSKAYFCQIPGTMSFSRQIRAVFEYFHYFIIEINAVLFFIILMIYVFNRIYIDKLIKSIRSYLNKTRLYIK